MSPEQASGEKTVDARSDQYSLACLLYEMVTGLPPFIGATQQSVISQRFTQPPPSMRAHRPNVPEHVERAVKRALALVPADRFASVTDFIAALHEPGSVAAPVSTHSIRRRWFAVGAAAALVVLAVMAAEPGKNWVRGVFGPQLDTTRFVVLPFAATSTASTGSVDVTASLISSLDRWDGVSVIDEATARNALGIGGAADRSLGDALDAARKLGAGRLVWGNVARELGRIRINAGLYDVASGKSIRDTVYVSNSPALPDSSLRRVLNALLVVPSFPAGFDDGQDGTTSYAAWQAYLRGIVQLNRGDFDGAERELANAVRVDARFAVANVWLAYASSIVSPKEQHVWTPIAGRALAMREQLRPRDAVRAEGLLALGRSDYEKSCDTFRALVQGDSLDAHAWVSLAECILVDERVLPNARGPSSWRFRTSWDEGGRALLQALELEPRLHSSAMFSRLRMAYTPSLNQLRPGVYIGSDSVPMWAYPTASAETLAFVPHPVEVRGSGRANENPAAQERAIDRNRAVLLRSARSWVAVAPQSGDAFEALAGVLETHGQLTGQDPNTSALASIQRARTLSSAAKGAPLAGIHVRLLLKAEQFAMARALVDSLLRSLRGSEDFPELRASMSALAGKPTGMVRGIMKDHFGNLPTLEAPLIQSAAEFLAYAALGACSSALGDAEERVGNLLVSYVAPGQMASVRRRLVNDALSLSASCSAGAAVSRAQPPEPLIIQMQQHFARGNPAGVRAGFDSLARIRRGRRASRTSPDHLFREAWLRAAIGDTAEAVVQLDAVLNALPTLPAVTLDNAVQAASLVRAMALRAELAAGQGERDLAKRWATAVQTLWANADPVLRPTIERMKMLAR
jgi:serine/threonine-protein kinase